jgi:hypothetical protein
MLFALHDYLQYRCRKGRYERSIIKSSLMGGAFAGSLPDTGAARSMATPLYRLCEVAADVAANESTRASLARSVVQPLR